MKEFISMRSTFVSVYVPLSFALAVSSGLPAAAVRQAHATAGSQKIQSYINNMSALLDSCSAAARSYRTLLEGMVAGKQGSAAERAKMVSSTANSYKAIAIRIETMRNIPPGAAASRKTWLKAAAAYRLKSDTLRKLVSGQNDNALHAMELIDDHLTELVKQAIAEDTKAGILPKIPAASGPGAAAGRPVKSRL